MLLNVEVFLSGSFKAGLQPQNSKVLLFTLFMSEHFLTWDRKRSLILYYRGVNYTGHLHTFMKLEVFADPYELSVQTNVREIYEKCSCIRPNVCTTHLCKISQNLFLNVTLIPTLVRSV